MKYTGHRLLDGVHYMIREQTTYESVGVSWGYLIVFPRGANRRVYGAVFEYFVFYFLSLLEDIVRSFSE